ncbi:Endo-beta-N-acetylglucosaminidase D [Actinomyces bovis]|uniref:Endo-beta-N-acetylglucosaminidase D n=1 Tax=Actinomyces bovis TaxID=1658 RepID=A0ABY1VNM6_9ACTO|nr:endo-beta-N-acetylglucosaminidase [Actinomyces bovis]SPT53715.1 Endo-beta-N-acetylglucosaminidase D [Actinomyces bovis]VEG55861.1 Endo-beta-N-acetylglucosaminidase D [Actinomyces israelii]
MKRKLWNRCAGAALVVALGAAGITSTALAADSYPPTGEQALGSAQPRFAGYRVQDIRDWSPQSDPFAADLRAEVPLQPRIQAPAQTQANPTLDGKAQVMLMQGDYGNAFFNTSTANNDFTENTLGFWQYTDYYSPWHGAATASTPDSLYDPANSDWRNRGFEFGIVNIPNPAYTNAAHRNGVKSIATIYFDPAFRPGLTFKEMFDKDPQSQGYVIAEKLIEMAKYYGFDGYFLNQEERADASEFKPFMSYLTSKGLWTQWYDVNSYFDASKAAWLKDQKHGQIHNSVFVNYQWGWSVDSSLSYAQSHGVDPYQEVFFGVEANKAKFSGSDSSARSVPRLYAPGTKSPRASLALFTPSDFYQRALDDDVKVPGYQRPLMQTPDFQWMIHERERMYFTGVTKDVTDTGTKQGFKRPDVGVRDASGWVGVADFAPARSVIGGSQFHSTFNTGHGMARWTGGVPSSNEQWGNINEQSILPSWQWWITKADGTTAQPDLTADFDYGSQEVRRDTQGATTQAPFKQVGAYDGGSSLAIHGKLEGAATMRLFRTDLTVGAASRVELVARNVTGSPALRLGVVDKADPGKVVPVDLAATGTDANGWTTYAADLSGRAGSTISTLALLLEGNGDVQVNLGRLALTDGGAAPAAPASLAVEHAYADGQASITWDAAPFKDVNYYELSAAKADGSVTALGATYASRAYIKKLDLSGGPVTLRLVAVGKDGQRSQPAEAVINPSTGAGAIKVTPAQSSEAGSQGLDLSFTPVPGADGYRATLELVHTGCEKGALSWTRTLSGSELSTDADGRVHAALTVPFREGRDYDLSITPLKGGAPLPGGQVLALRDKLPDTWARPLPAADVRVEGSQMRLSSPTPADWHKITVTSGAGKEVFSATRGEGGQGVVATNERLQVPFDISAHLTDGAGTFELRLTDYTGNTSEPTVVTVQGGNSVSVKAPTEVPEQSCVPGAIEDPQDPQPSPSPTETAAPSPTPSPDPAPGPGQTQGTMPAYVAHVSQTGSGKVLVGDWDGDGQVNWAVRVGSRVVFYARNSLDAPVYSSISLGRASDEVYVGDWDGDGRATLALRRGSRVMYQKTLTSTATTVDQVDAQAKLVVKRVDGKDVLTPAP